jgi:acyl-CoA synthetase (AMP-forming)/AMP-acid ligase II
MRRLLWLDHDSYSAPLLLRESRAWEAGEAAPWLDLYQPVANVARHHSWDWGMRRPAALECDAAQRPDFTIAPSACGQGDEPPADAAALPCAVQAWGALLSGPDVPADTFRFERVGADHPLWIVFSSGTTGLPKAIVHSHAGMLVEHLKGMHLHMDLRVGDVMFFYSTTGWMMWNLLVAALLSGASAVLYDGSPMHGGADCLWKLAADARATCFGGSPRHVPDVMIEMEQIPYTLTGKKMEVPVRKILMGRPVEQAASRDAMANPAALDAYVAFAGTVPR